MAATSILLSWRSLGSLKVDLGTPIPRDLHTRHEPFAWPDGEQTTLPPPEPREADLYEVLSYRRSNREFRPLAMQALSNLFWHSSRCLERESSDLGFDLERRPHPSAGAIHPIHTLIRRSGHQVWERYLPREHALCCVTGAWEILKSLEEALQPIFSTEDMTLGTVLLWVAEPGMTEAKYSDAGSLIWRDAGVVQGTVGLVATGLGLSFCLAGPTGAAEVSKLSEGAVELVGVGTALVGQNRYSAA